MAKNTTKSELTPLGETTFGNPEKGHCKKCGLAHYTYFKNKDLCPPCDGYTGDMGLEKELAAKVK